MRKNRIVCVIMAVGLVTPTFMLALPVKGSESRTGKDYLSNQVHSCVIGSSIPAEISQAISQRLDNIISMSGRRVVSAIDRAAALKILRITDIDSILTCRQVSEVLGNTDTFVIEIICADKLCDVHLIFAPQDQPEATLRDELKWSELLRTTGLLTERFFPAKIDKDVEKEESQISISVMQQQEQEQSVDLAGDNTFNRGAYLWSGGLIFGTAWLLGGLGPNIIEPADEREKYVAWIPIVGPFISAGLCYNVPVSEEIVECPPGTPETLPDGREVAGCFHTHYCDTLGIAFYIADGSFQVLGAILLGIGIFSDDEKNITETANHSRVMFIGPDGNPGLFISGAF